MVHVLKILPKYFYDVFRGIKTFEVRKNDRTYSIGDLIEFKISQDSWDELINEIYKSNPDDGTLIALRNLKSSFEVIKDNDGNDYLHYKRNYRITYILNDFPEALISNYIIFGIAKI